MLKIKSKKRWHIGLVPILLLIAIILPAQIGDKVGATGMYNITGKVTSANGSGISGVTIVATYPGTGIILFGPVTSNANGYYTLPIDAGTYDITFSPGSGSFYDNSTSYNYVVTGNQTYNKQLPARINTMTGTLTDSADTPIANARVTLSNGGAYATTLTDSNGNYSLSIAAGIYALSLSGSQVRGMSTFTVSQSTSNPGINLTNSITRNLKLLTVNVSATPYNDAGQASYSTSLIAQTTQGTTILYSGDVPETVSVLSTGSTSGSSSTATISTIVGASYSANGLNAPNYTNSICKSINGSYNYDCLTTPLTVNAPTTAAVPAAPPVSRNFSGVLTDGNNVPMSSVTVTLVKYSDRSTTAVTSSSGAFSINAEPGKYYLEVSGNGNNGMQSFKLTQSSVSPSIDLSTSNITQNLQIQTANLTVTAYDGSGNLNYNSNVTAQTNAGTTTLYSGDPGEAITVNSFGFNTSPNPTGTIGTINGASYSAKGLNNVNSSGSICTKNTASTWNCLTTAYIVSGAASVAVPQ